jgi:hypothetical protein
MRPLIYLISVWAVLPWSTPWHIRWVAGHFCCRSWICRLKHNTGCLSDIAQGPDCTIRARDREVAVPGVRPRAPGCFICTCWVVYPYGILWGLIMLRNCSCYFPVLWPEGRNNVELQTCGNHLRSTLPYKEYQEVQWNLPKTERDRSGIYSPVFTGFFPFYKGLCFNKTKYKKIWSRRNTM